MAETVAQEASPVTSTSSDPAQTKTVVVKVEVPILPIHLFNPVDLAAVIEATVRQAQVEANFPRNYGVPLVSVRMDEHDEGFEIWLVVELPVYDRANLPVVARYVNGTQTHLGSSTTVARQIEMAYRGHEVVKRVATLLEG